MAIGIIQGRFQFQRGTHKEWTDSDLILLDGELAIESDTSKIKIGNGRSLYKDLPYIEIGRIGVKDLTEEDLEKITGEKGDKGDPFTYDDLTAEQKLELRGEPGKDGYTPRKGVDYFDGKPGRKGDKGDPLRFEDLTNAQKEQLKGEPGKDGTMTFEDLTPAQKASLKGEKGDPGKDGTNAKIIAGTGITKSGDTISINTSVVARKSDLKSYAMASQVPKLVCLTKSEYDALTTKDSSTYYFIKE